MRNLSRVITSFNCLDVEEELEQLMVILAVGVKDRNRVIIGGEEIEL